MSAAETRAVGGGAQPTPIELRQLLAIAQSEYSARRHRDRMLGGGLFAEPAWDMLLDLYIQHHRGRPVSTHSLCIAAAVPQTTALRWIGRLVAAGYAMRRGSDLDHRVVHVALSARGLAEMERYLGDRLRHLSAILPQLSGSAS